ncbi:MAG: prepilin-type N-terminal cleavage/methylation domain-containing protein [Coprobacillaceae bacterium]
MQNRKGFTLVEMLFTLFIITLLSLVSLTFYNTKSDEKIVLENYMEVKSIIEEARTIALTTHRKVSLEINKNRIGYQNDSHERILELSKDI